ncbi:MAG: HAD hydrolase family protein [Spirochaetaceae bacterium]|jgi:YrbI family 3-deoxy-D-manno-octulosonate 8-phosphate phosphatase|nr:HAD hydrolase family protein [Spirochaetaceae bacterium]
MKYIITDVDGVLTDGSVTVDAQGNETKKICYRDLDAIGIGRRAGYEFILVTGENTAIARFISSRFGIETAFFGAKNKLSVMRGWAAQAGIELSSVIFIGDSDNDIELLEAAGLGIAPHDGTFRAKQAAKVITDAKGGTGVLLEVVDKLLLNKLSWPGNI